VPPVFEDADRQAAERLIEIGLAEDLAQAGDLTAAALIPPEAAGALDVVARAEGVLAGGPVAQLVYARIDPRVEWTTIVEDGSRVCPRTSVARVSGPLDALLSGERLALNVLMHQSGIATLTRRFVDAVAGSKARILDTRKTLPGWRRLEKYAVRAGGGHNHRMGLHDGCLIKDNHLAAWKARRPEATIADAVHAARANLRARGIDVPVEVEVESLEQLADALAGRPEIVLLDNMDAAMLSACVALRDEKAPQVLLEASGGVTLARVAAIAATGVDRISVGAITHSAPALDLACDWSHAQP
jgi:nicotinate-nucleotide pyrophosphorylase (carboxylating)